MMGATVVGKRRRHRDDFIAGLHAAVLQLGRRECGKGDQVCRGTGVDQQDVLHAEKFGQAGFKFIGVSPGRQPEIQRRIHEIDQFLLIEVAPRVAHRVFAGAEGVGGVRGVKLADEFQDLAAEGFLVAHGWTEIRNQRSEVGGRRTEVRRQTTEDRGQRSEGAHGMYSARAGIDHGGTVFGPAGVSERKNNPTTNAHHS
jgi:hypothetical protein